MKHLPVALFSTPDYTAHEKELRDYRRRKVVDTTIDAFSKVVRVAPAAIFVGFWGMVFSFMLGPDRIWAALEVLGPLVVLGAAYRFLGFLNRSFK